VSFDAIAQGGLKFPSRSKDVGAIGSGNALLNRLPICRNHQQFELVSFFTLAIVSSLS
jgi:hypothetical protein